MKKAAKLVESAREAAEVRAHQTNPNVVALNVERIRTWVNVFFWVGITLGLTFTMANVQSFAAVGAEKYSIQWFIAWLLDPMVSLPLLGVLIGEQILTRYNVKSGAWVHVVKWVTLSCTYAMNTWQAWAAHDPAKILLHSVPPLIVVCAAEGLTDLRHRITEAVAKAVETAITVQETGSRPVLETGSPDREDRFTEPVRETAGPGSENRDETGSQNRPKTGSQDREETEETGSQRRPRTTPRRPRKTVVPIDRDELIRSLNAEHIEEHNRPISADKLVEKVRANGHKLGKVTALQILADLNGRALAAVK